jgi:hypothetical protein
MRAITLSLCLILLSTFTGCAKDDPLFIAPSNQQLMVSPLSDSINIDTTRQFQALLLGDDGSQTDVTALADWSSDIPALATIDQAGVATGVAEGNAVITASYQQLEADAQLTVTDKPMHN